MASSVVVQYDTVAVAVDVPSTATLPASAMRSMPSLPASASPAAARCAANATAATRRAAVDGAPSHPAADTPRRRACSPPPCHSPTTSVASSQRSSPLLCGAAACACDDTQGSSGSQRQCRQQPGSAGASLRTPSSWSLRSWRRKPIVQQPQYPSAAALEASLDERALPCRCTVATRIPHCSHPRPSRCPLVPQCVPSLA